MEYNYPNTEPESLLEKVYRVLKTPTSTRTASIVIGVILLVSLPVFLLVSQQRTQTQQQAAGDETQRRDCYLQISTGTDPNNRQGQDGIVRIKRGERFGLTLNLLNTPGNPDPTKSQFITKNERAVINYGPVVPDGLIRGWGSYNNNQQPPVSNAVWVSRLDLDKNTTGNTRGFDAQDLVEELNITFYQEGTYVISTTVADRFVLPTSEDGQPKANPLYPPRPHCLNEGNTSGWIQRIIVVSDEIAPGVTIPPTAGPSGNNIVIQTLVHEDGRTAKLRRCPINTASTDPLGMFGACENWSEINLAPGDSYQGYDSFAYKNGTTTYAMQTLVHEDGRTAKTRRCTMNPNASGVIGAFGTCASWVEFNLPSGDSYRGLDTLLYRGMINAVPTTMAIQTLVHSDGRTAKLRQCLLFDVASNDPLAAFQKCQEWEEINLTPGDSYREYDSFSYMNGTATYAIQSLTHEDGRTAKSRTCTMNTNGSNAVGALGSCGNGEWKEFNLASGDSYRGYDALYYLGSGTGILLPSIVGIVVTAAPTPNLHPDTTGQCTTGDTNRWKYTCSVATNTTWACSGDVTNFRNIKCYKDCSDTTEITSCPVVTPTPAYGAYNCNAGGTPGHCAASGAQPYASSCGGTYAYQGTGCSAGQMCYTECPGDPAPVNPPVSCQSIGTPAVCPNNPNKCLQTCNQATGTYWVVDPATSTHYASCTSSTAITSCPVSTTPTPTLPGGANTPTPTLHDDPPLPSTTPTLPAGNAQLSFNLELQGIGNATQGQAPKNASPKNPSRNLTVEIYDATTNRAVFTNTFSNAITYNSATGLFAGTVTVGPIQDGRYIVKVKTPKYLRRLIGKSTNRTTVDITTGQNNSMFQETLTGGNANNDNALTTADYQMYLPCFGKTVATYINLSGRSYSCKDVDFNDDDINDSSVNNNLLDFNLLKVAFSVQDGD